jgi:hypothetical protein
VQELQGCLERHLSTGLCTLSAQCHPAISFTLTAPGPQGCPQTISGLTSAPNHLPKKSRSGTPSPMPNQQALIPMVIVSEALATLSPVQLAQHLQADVVSSPRKSHLCKAYGSYATQHLESPLNTCRPTPPTTPATA